MTTSPGLATWRWGQLGDVDEPFDAAEVDEGAEVGEGRHAARASIAHVDLGHQLCLRGTALDLDHDAAVHHDLLRATLGGGDFAGELLALDDLHRDVGADERSAVALAHVDQRLGEERAHAQIDDEAALGGLLHPVR